ncbi:MAG TPA: hypothetical protein VGO40_13140 [Longimicrobium sp.]|nr:hypothetical protein [Longimicrobium sp.]
MNCVELSVQFEGPVIGPDPVERPKVENLRAALEETLDATLRVFHGHSGAAAKRFVGYSEHLYSDLVFSGNECSLTFQVKHIEPLSCRLFEQFATDVIQCVASTYLFVGSGMSVDSLLPDLYEDRVLLFWGSFTKHAPLSPLRTRLALRSPTCWFEKTLDRTEYGIWVTNFDRLLEGASAKSETGESGTSDTLPRTSLSSGEGSGGAERIVEHVESLRAAAEVQDEDAFVHALALVPREGLAADDYVSLMRLALAAGAHNTARELSAVAHARFPADRDVRQFATVLGPPAIMSREPLTASAADAQEWLKHNASRYTGQWVALRRGELLAAGAALSDVRHSIGSLAGTFVTRIP